MTTANQIGSNGRGRIVGAVSERSQLRQTLAQVDAWKARGGAPTPAAHGAVSVWQDGKVCYLVCTAGESVIQAALSLLAEQGGGGQTTDDPRQLAAGPWYARLNDSFWCSAAVNVYGKRSPSSLVQEQIRNVESYKAKAGMGPVGRVVGGRLVVGRSVGDVVGLDTSPYVFATMIGFVNAHGNLPANMGPADVRAVAQAAAQFWGLLNGGIGGATHKDADGKNALDAPTEEQAVWVLKAARDWYLNAWQGKAPQAALVDWSVLFPNGFKTIPGRRIGGADLAKIMTMHVPGGYKGQTSSQPILGILQKNGFDPALLGLGLQPLPAPKFGDLIDPSGSKKPPEKVIVTHNTHKPDPGGGFGLGPADVPGNLQNSLANVARKAAAAKAAADAQMGNGDADAKRAADAAAAKIADAKAAASSKTAMLATIGVAVGALVGGVIAFEFFGKQLGQHAGTIGASIGGAAVGLSTLASRADAPDEAVKALAQGTP